MQFLAETTKTKQIHTNSEPKLQVFNWTGLATRDYFNKKSELMLIRRATASV